MFWGGGDRKSLQLPLIICDPPRLNRRREDFNQTAPFSSDSQRLMLRPLTSSVPSHPSPVLLTPTAIFSSKVENEGAPRFAPTSPLCFIFLTNFHPGFTVGSKKASSQLIRTTCARMHVALSTQRSGRKRPPTAACAVPFCQLAQPVITGRRFDAVCQLCLDR